MPCTPSHRLFPSLGKALVNPSNPPEGRRLGLDPESTLLIRPDQLGQLKPLKSWPRFLDFDTSTVDISKNNSLCNTASTLH